MAVSQFKDFMILVLIAAAFVSGFIGDVSDTIVILAIVVLNAAIGFVQDYRAERAMAALKRLAALKATVIRDGRRHGIAASEIVPGDIVLLEAGNIVPADLRLTEAPQLKVAEAALTGEAVPVEKHAEDLTDAALPLADQTNMAFKGTVVTYGARAVLRSLPAWRPNSARSPNCWRQFRRHRRLSRSGSQPSDGNWRWRYWSCAP